MGNRLKEYKTNELRAKREAGLAVEKEEYYQRLIRQSMQSVKTLESELVEWELKICSKSFFFFIFIYSSSYFLNIKGKILVPEK